MKVATRVAGAIVALAAIPLTALPAQAAPTRDGCQRGFELKSLDYVLSQAAEGFEGAITDADANKDNLLCYKLLPDAIPLFDPTFLYDDNNLPIN
jgi:hypothetical protein